MLLGTSAAQVVDHAFVGASSSWGGTCGVIWKVDQAQLRHRLGTPIGYLLYVGYLNNYFFYTGIGFLKINGGIFWDKFSLSN
jgi:hypothetical protein